MNFYIESHQLLNYSDDTFNTEELAKAPILLHGKTRKCSGSKEFLSSSDDLPTPLQEFYQNGILVGRSKLF